MSKLNGGLYSSDSHKWETPPDLVDRLLKFENRTMFDLDPACSRPNIPAQIYYFSDKYDGLAAPWDIMAPAETLAFLNPPYGAELPKFLQKVCEEAAKGVKIWVLIPARTETRYQHKYGLTQAGFTVFITERLCFYEEGYPYMMPVKKNGVPTGKYAMGNAPFPSMLMYYGPDAEEKATRWSQDPPIKGTLMKPVDTSTII